jgi:hypothetical protein
MPVARESTEDDFLRLKDILEAAPKIGIDDSRPTEAMKKKMSDIQRSDYMDFLQVKAETQEEAERLINSIVSFYISEPIRNSVPLVQERIKLDIMTFTDLSLQMKTFEHAIIKLLEDIDEGNYSLKSFDSLSNLQNAKLSIVRHLQQYAVGLHNVYQTIHQQCIDKNPQLESIPNGLELPPNTRFVPVQTIEDLNDTVSRSKKSLLNDLQNQIAMENKRR